MDESNNEPPNNESSIEIPVQEDHESNADEDDEGIGGVSQASQYEPVPRSAFHFVEKHGRTYQQGKYLLPNDEEEKERLDFQHEVFRQTFDKRRLYLAPIEEKKGGFVLDMGTGTGIWAIEFADEHPGAKVIGADISPIQPTLVPPNLEFVIDDLEKPWNDEKYTFIHGRMVFSHLQKPMQAIQRAFDALQPGGFLEIQDTLLWVRNDESISQITNIQQLTKLLGRAAWKAGLDWNGPSKYKRWMEEIGFVDVTEVEYRWLLNPNTSDKNEMSKADYCKSNFLSLLESTAAFTEYLSPSQQQEMTILLAIIKNQIKNGELRGYIPVIVVYGQKEKQKQREERYEVEHLLEKQ